VFKVGELVTTLNNERVGLVVDSKVRMAMQYCYVLFLNCMEPEWVLYTTLKEEL
jgi:hypothetical protein